MKRAHKNLAIFFMVASMYLSGCTSDFVYKCDNPDLYTVAIDSIPDTYGFISGEAVHPPVVALIEQDNYERKLFCYTELRGEGITVFLVISQGSDGEYVYYYSGYNYISGDKMKGNQVLIYGSRGPSTIDNPLNDFSDEEIAQLKEANDWNQELQLEQCKKVKIVRSKTELTNLDE